MPYVEEDCIDILYQLYEQPLYYEAYKILHDEYLAEDAVHEGFLRLIRNRDKIKDPRSPQIRSYVYKTLRSAALDIYRKQKHQRDHCCDMDEAISIPAADRTESTYIAVSCVDDLPQKYASVLRCLFVRGLTVRETSAVLKISEVCVRKRLERARKMLQGKIYNSMKKESYYER